MGNDVTCDNETDDIVQLRWLLQEAAEEAMYCAYHHQRMFVVYRYSFLPGVMAYDDFVATRFREPREVFFVAMPNLSDRETLTFDYLFTCRGRSDPQ